MVIVHVTVAGADLAVYSLVVSQPLGGVVESAGSNAGHEIVALVSPDPPSLKLT
jgi:hypothetical protein